MEPLRLSLSCNEYDRTRFLVDGSVQAEGIDLNFENSNWIYYDFDWTNQD